MSLARFIVLKSNASNKYLCHGKDKGATHASLRFSREMKRPKAAEFLESENKIDESLTSEKSMEFHLHKLEVEEAKTAKGFVHIRTCYNHKYWVRKSADTKTIVAEAHEPEEDQSKWSCTLFKPVFLGDADDETDVFVPPNAKRPQRIQLIHISELGHHPLAACPNTTSLEVRHVDPSETETIALKSGSAAATVTFTSFDVEPTVILPVDFTFMSGDGDGKYMAAYNGDSLGFTTTDVGTEGVAMLTYQAEYPTYMPLLIRQPYRKWRINQNNDVGLVDEGGHPSYFGPVKFDKYVVLRCQQNNNFVSRTQDDGVSCRSSTITTKSMLKIGEPVTLRTILSAEYKLEDARIYNASNIQKYVDSMANNTSQVQNTAFEVEYKTSKTMSWNQSTEVHVGVSASWSFGFPYVGDFGIEVSYDRTQTCQWGEEESHEDTVKITRNVTIPPRKKVTLKVIATKSSCDVPFTCKVRDVMCDGRVKEYTKTDGLFVGSNEFNFTTVMDEADL